MIASIVLGAKKCSKLSYTMGNNFSNTYEVMDAKNSHLLFLKDPSGSLPFMSEITLQSGEKGVVIKIGQKNVTAIGMYHRMDVSSQINIKKCEKIKDLCSKFKAEPNFVYDIEGNQLSKKLQPISNDSVSAQLKIEGKRKRLYNLSPILSICQDIFVGDMVGFAGPLASFRTTNTLQYLQAFVNAKGESNQMGIYLNTSQKDSNSTCVKAASYPNTLSFGRDKNAKPLTSVGVYMLAIKTIEIGKRLKKEGKNVMLVVDNLQQILANEWTTLQNLKQPISPISILNQLYSNSSNNSLNSKTSGSLTSLFANNPQDQDVLQEYTTFGNNSKYLRTLCHQIQHPIQIRMNNNPISSNELLNRIRQKVNRLVKEKKDTELLTRLKLNKDDPWEQYYILDSDWWMSAIKTYRPKSFADLQLFLWFIDINIEEDYCAHWNITCKEAYSKYIQYLADPVDLQIGMDLQQFENFIELAKVDGFFDVFKKDYLL